MLQENTPAESAPSEDIGAETGYRFGYQDMWAAILACSLIDQPAQFVEMYCEHHEDILLKRADGKFNAIQVKTRNLSAAAWKANDEDVIKSLCRFILLDAQFPNQFDRFTFATNHFFFETAKTGQNICHVLLEVANTADLATAPAIVKKLVSKLAKITKRNHEEIFKTLKKTSCTADLPKLKDGKRALCETIIAVYAPAEDAVPAKISKASNQLIASIRAASALAHLDALPSYISLLDSGAATEIRERINGKKFTPERVLEVLKEAITNTSLLVPAASESIPTGESQNRLAKKLEAGGLSVVTINLATDLRAAALYHFVEWRERFGEKEALRRYEHLKTLVLKDCAAAHEETKNDQEAFGRKMLESLRVRLDARAALGNSEALGCRAEHLEGCAYELTGACKVWWSEQFDITGA